MIHHSAYHAEEDNKICLTTHIRYGAVKRTTDEELRSSKEEKVDKLPADG